MKWAILLVLLLWCSKADAAGFTRHGLVNNTDEVANEGDGVVGVKPLGQVNTDPNQLFVGPFVTGLDSAGQPIYGTTTVYGQTNGNSNVVWKASFASILIYLLPLIFVALNMEEFNGKNRATYKPQFG